MFNSLIILFNLDLEKPEFIVRHEIYGKMLSAKQAMNIIDIGAYYNPINLFFNPYYCPQSIIIVEPILEPLSVLIPCNPTESTQIQNNTNTHYIILPITFKHYIEIKSKLPVISDSVVCIGCDSHYGPNRKMLETSFQRPYSLYLEYPSEYVHNAPFKKMMGNQDSTEKLSYIHKINVNTTDTQYTKRVMKVIDYS